VRDAAEPLGRPATVGEDEVALIMYTSGTTGLP
jgi:long-subunit acyl-CoA synthetase (AMP-forming)